MTDELEALPTVVTVTQDFARRLPTQRVCDVVVAAEGIPFGELVQLQPTRLTAFRALIRDYPTRDTTSLWLHAYDVEVAIAEVDPTNGTSPTPGPPFATTGVSTPTP
jgi:hypothetical protein